MTQVNIIGGGVQGMMIAYDLASAGAKVRVIEAAPALGGLAGAMHLDELDDLQVDRFYHCILSSDARLMALIDELGLRDQLHFTTTSMAFASPHHGLQSLSSPAEFLRFPLISFPTRVRLALSLLYSAFVVQGGDHLESVSVESWLRQIGGDENFDALWGPLLRSKFDDRFDDLPASYMHARLQRMISTRDKTSGAEQMGHLVGGYQTLIEALRERLVSMGADIMLQTPVQSLQYNKQGDVTGVKVQTGKNTRVLKADVTVLTVGNERLRQWLEAPLPPQVQKPLETISYLAIVCPLLVLDRSLSDYYTINLVDRSVRMTGVIETTRIIDPALLDGRHLVYLPYYCRQDSDLLDKSDDEIMALALRELGQILPGFQSSWIQTQRVMRARATEPIHPMAPTRQLLPYRSGIGGLYLSNSTQVYPDLVNCEAMTANVMRALPAIYCDHATLRPGSTCLSR